jgi:hypothetical protein
MTQATLFAPVAGPSYLTLNPLYGLNLCCSMAHYLVTAKPKSDRLSDLLGNLHKGLYVPMRPFGKSMTYSLENARLREDGYAIWEEEDYCSPPLAQERAAALDEFFEELSVTPVHEGEGWKKIGALPRLFPETADSQGRRRSVEFD